VGDDVKVALCWEHLPCFKGSANESHVSKSSIFWLLHPCFLICLSKLSQLTSASTIILLTMALADQKGLMSLSSDLRPQIYELLFNGAHLTLGWPVPCSVPNTGSAILATCKQIYEDTLPIAATNSLSTYFMIAEPQASF
jgi:hypothetical protein